MLTYAFKDQKGIKVLELSGTLTSSTSDLFKELVVNVVDKESLIINMENVTFVTTSGLNSLVEVSFTAKDNNRRVIILWPGEDLLLMAENLDMTRHLIFADSLELAGMKINYFT